MGLANHLCSAKEVPAGRPYQRPESVRPSKVEAKLESHKLSHNWFLSLTFLREFLYVLTYLRFFSYEESTSELDSGSFVFFSKVTAR